MKKIRNILLIIMVLFTMGVVNVHAAYYYTVKFNANGGTGTMKNQTIKSGSSVALSANTFTKRGYSFASWNISAKGTSKSYTDKQKVYNLVSKAGSKTLYAQWKKTKYTIKYNLNGGTNNSKNPSYYYVTSSTIYLQTPTRTGYKFLGWYKESTFKTKVTSIAKGTVYNKTFYAKWSANTYTIAFNGNGQTSGSMSSLSSRKYGTTYTLTSNAYKKTGYTFTGWNTKADGSGKTYANKASIKNLTSVNGKTITLYATWSKTKYTITYNLNGGTNSSKNPSYYYVNSSTITLQTPIREGYTFAGWYKESTYNTKVTSITKGSTGNITLYAKWDANTYTIVFNGNSATSGTMSSLTDRKYGTTYTLTSNAYKKTGYKFIGWNTESDGSGTIYADKANIKNLTSTNGKTIKLYAMWEEISYSVTYNLNGGVNDAANPEYYSINSGLIIFFDPIKTGYTFKGWYLDSEFTNAITKIESGSTGNKELYAKWEENTSDNTTYTITYILNGGINNEANPISYKSTDTEIKFYEPTREGYIFAGWYLDSEFIMQIDSLENGTENLTIYAKWIAEDSNKFVIYLKYDNYESLISADEYDITETLTGPFSYTGKIEKDDGTYKYFVGWNTSEDGSGLNIAETQIVSPEDYAQYVQNNKLTLYAIYQDSIKTYHIVYMDEQFSDLNLYFNGLDEYATLAKNNVEIEGQEFVGWSTKSDGKGYIFAEQDSIYGEDAVKYIDDTDAYSVTLELYPVWKYKFYSITYYNLKDAVNSNPNSYTIVSDTITLNDITLNGYTFKGWYLDSEFTNAITKIESGSTGNKELYAKWEENTKEQTGFTLEFDANNVNCSNLPDAVENITSYEFTSDNEPTADNFIFKGWDVNPNATTPTYTRDTTILLTGDIKLYAIWESSSYTIQFNDNGGSDGPGTIVKNISEDLIIPDTIPTRDQYTFLGWSKSKNDTTTLYQAGETFQDHSSFMLYAIWEHNTYRLSYTYSDSHLRCKNLPSSSKDNYEYTISDEIPTRTGYKFLGWSTSKDNLIAEYKAGDKITITDNTYLYAVWEEDTTLTPTLSYDANGGTGDIPNQTGSQSYQVSTIEPTRSDYDFQGWTLDDFTKNIDFKPGDSINITKDTVLYAVWKRKTSKITFCLEKDSNGNCTSEAFTLTGSSIYEVPTTIPVDGSKTFIGWSGDGLTLLPGDRVALNPSTSEYVVVAQWASTSATYTVSFNAGDGTGAPSSLSNNCKYFIIPDTSPTRDGYVFLGWTTIQDSNDKENPVEYRANYVINAAQEHNNGVYGVELYAKWAKEILKGDTNLDGYVDTNDYDLITDYFSFDRQLTDEQFERCDINGDSKVDYYDYIALTRLIYS